MKKLFPSLTIVLAISACGSNPPEPKQNLNSQASLAPELSQEWETTGLRVPESVLYHKDSSGEYLLVAEIEGEGNVADGQGGIAKLSLSGDIIEQDWVRNLDAPKGMGAHDGKLYVADITAVAVIDIASQTIEARIDVPNSVFLNDIAIDREGVVYVSDTRTHKIHRLVNRTPEVYLEDIEGANGLTFVDSNLYIAASSNLWKVDADKNVSKIAAGFEEAADGIEMIKPGEFIVSCWAGIIYHVDATGNLTTILDTRENNKNTADIGWNNAEKILYVPTFYKNSVVAYKL